MNKLDKKIQIMETIAIWLLVLIMLVNLASCADVAGTDSAEHKREISKEESAAAAAASAAATRAAVRVRRWR